MVLFVVHFENEDMILFQGTRVPEISECQTFCDDNRAYIEEHFDCNYNDLGDVEKAEAITRECESDFEVQENWAKFIPTVQATICLCNTASVNIWKIEDERVLAGINNDAPEWCELMTDEEGTPYFQLDELECLLSNAMRIENGGDVYDDHVKRQNGISC